MTTLLLLALSLTQDPAKAAEKDLQKAIKDYDAAGVDKAAKALLLANTPAAMKALLATAAKGPPEKDDAGWIEAYATMLNAAATFAAPAALAELGEFILKNKDKPVARDAMAAVCNHAQKGIDAICVRVLEAGTPDLKIMAADHLVAIAGKAQVPALIAALKANEKDGGDLKKRLGHALTVLTGQDYGDSVTNWEGWWEANKDKDWAPKAGEGASTGTATDGLDRSRMSEFERLKKTGTVLVLEAGEGCKCKKNHDLDHIDQVTEKMGLKTERITKAALDAGPDPKLENYVAILANCTHIREHCACPECKPGKYSGNRLFTCECPINKHDPVKYVLGEKGLARLKKYLEGGGYLFAEDWCMEDFVARAFPEHVTNGSIRPDELVTVLPKPGSSNHPYLRKIFFRPPPSEARDTVTEQDFEKIGHSWKIDKETRTIRVKDPAKVTTLLVSPDLKKKAQGDEAVAVTFEALPPVASKGGKNAAVASGTLDRKKMTGGRVLYVLSHFGKQASATDEYALQNLLINFLVEASERRGTFEAPKK